MGREVSASCFKPWCSYAFGVAYSDSGVIFNDGVTVEDPESWCRVSRCIFYVTRKGLDGLCDMVECRWQEYQRREVRS